MVFTGIKEHAFLLIESFTLFDLSLLHGCNGNQNIVCLNTFVNFDYIYS